MLSKQYSISVYIHIIQVSDHSNDKVKADAFTVDFQIQGHEQFFLTFHISDCLCGIEQISWFMAKWSRYYCDLRPE